MENITSQSLSQNPYAENLLRSLNDAQREAVAYCDGPALVIAGAGSGKTRVLTYKIAYLISLGMQPWSIMALTFTNKAAREMKERIAALLGDDRARYVWMGTFHSVFLRILRAEHEVIGFSSSFTIYDENDSRSLIKAIVRELGLDEKVYKPSSVSAVISKAKNSLVDAAAYVANGANREADLRSNMPEVGRIYERYAMRCRTADAMDFDDILLFTYQLFQQHPDVLKKYVDRINYLLVDEYQDTNFAQHQIVRQLTLEKQSLCVVGDDAQSIYSFRGADIDNILTFKNSYRDCRLFKLEQNYRSTQTIVNAANSLIHKNYGQIDKTVFSNKEVGEPIVVAQTLSDKEEAHYVARQIALIRKREQIGYGSFAILYRTNAQSRIFEEEFRSQGFPYKIYGGLSFYQRKEIKDIIAYLRLVANHNDEEAFKRIINCPKRGIGDTTVQKIISAATARNASLWDVLVDPVSFGLLLPSATFSRLQRFRQLVDGFTSLAASSDVATLATAVVKDSGIMADVARDDTPEGLSRKENIDELFGAMHAFCASRREEGNPHVSVYDYLNEVSLLSDTESDADANAEHITLMTVHSAKGLEFNTVFIVGLEEELFPSQRVMGNQRQLEEERRLFYVAITRAEVRCFLTFATSRYRYGRLENGRPSRFLADIDERYLDRKGSMRPMRDTSASVRLPWEERQASVSRPAVQRPVMPAPAPSQPMSRFVPLKKAAANRPSTASVSTPSGSLEVGTRIRHERFGVGVVEKLEGNNENTKMTVRFELSGVKQLLLKFARFEIV